MSDLATVQYTHRIITEQAKSIGANFLRYYSTDQISEYMPSRKFNRNEIPLSENWRNTLGPKGSKLVTNILLLPPVVRSVKISEDELSIEFNPAAIIDEFKEAIDQIFYDAIGLTPDFKMKLDALTAKLRRKLKYTVPPDNIWQREKLKTEKLGQAIEFSSEQFPPEVIFDNLLDYWDKDNRQ